MRRCRAIWIALLSAQVCAQPAAPSDTDGLNASELMSCEPALAAFVPRQLEIDRRSGSIAMSFGEQRMTGRFTIESGHLLAVFSATDAAGATQEFTIGLASGRTIGKQRLPDGSRPIVFRGICRVSGGAV